MSFLHLFLFSQAQRTPHSEHGKHQGEFSYDILIIINKLRSSLTMLILHSKITIVKQYFGGSKTTADGDFSHEIKRCLLLGRKAMTYIDSVLKSRDITLLTKVGLVKAMVSPVVMYGCESWTIKKAECLRIDAFELWCRRLLRVPWTARRSNQSIHPKGNQS